MSAVDELDTEAREDFVAALELEIADERDRLMRTLDRLDALRALHSIAQERATELGRPPTLEETFDPGDSELRRAELRSIGKRVTGEEVDFDG